MQRTLHKNVSFGPVWMQPSQQQPGVSTGTDQGSSSGAGAFEAPVGGAILLAQKKQSAFSEHSGTAMMASVLLVAYGFVALVMLSSWWARQGARAIDVAASTS
jgi:hypothetical protein